MKTSIKGSLYTKDYNTFNIINDVGDIAHTFSGSKFANKCLPGDLVDWDGEKCILEFRDEQPAIVGTIEFTNKSKYGLTSNGSPIYLFTPYDKKYPQMIVGCREKETSKNKIALVKFSEWKSNLPRANLCEIIGYSGDYDAELKAIIKQYYPWKHPKGPWNPELEEEYTQRTIINGFSFNIDPVGCKDVDDVITVLKSSDNEYIVTITISDVARYIKEGSVEDIFASMIGQTLYIDGAVEVSMLPSEYSEKCCSLLPNKKSYGISLQFKYVNNEIKDLCWIESELINHKSYTYEEFQELDSNNPEYEYKILLKHIAEKMYKESNNYDNSDKTELDDSHKYVEEFMKFYNKEAGKIIKKYESGILRRHSPPNIDKLNKYSKIIDSDISHLAYSAAEYTLITSQSINNDTFHFGLNTSEYAHASSPIRRYADLINQRVLKLYIKYKDDLSKKENYIVPISMLDINTRAKYNKSFDRDLQYLREITSGRKLFNAIILDISDYQNDQNDQSNKKKIRLYVKDLKRIINLKYKIYSEENSSIYKVLSADESEIIELYEGKSVLIKCAYDPNSRNWKDRCIFELK